MVRCVLRVDAQRLREQRVGLLPLRCARAVTRSAALCAPLRCRPTTGAPKRAVTLSAPPWAPLGCGPTLTPWSRFSRGSRPEKTPPYGPGSANAETRCSQARATVGYFQPKGEGACQEYPGDGDRVHRFSQRPQCPVRCRSARLVAGQPAPCAPWAGARTTRAPASVSPAHGTVNAAVCVLCAPGLAGGKTASPRWHTLTLEDAPQT